MLLLTFFSIIQKYVLHSLLSICYSLDLQLFDSPIIHKYLYNVLTLEDMNYTFGIQSLFRHTPLPPRSDIHLHSKHVYTLWTQSTAVCRSQDTAYVHNKVRPKNLYGLSNMDVDLLTQPSVTTLFVSSHSSPLEIWTMPSPQ